MPTTSKSISVALVFGGRSGEHEISVRSAQSIKAALDPSKYRISEYFIDPDGTWHPGPIVPEPGGNPGIDVVFPALHGTFGEDGTVQGLLELAGLPYVGAGVLASAVSMDKAVTKKLCAQAGLPVVEHLVVTRGCFDSSNIVLPFAFPVFVKPANLGSSVGITKAKNADELKLALETAAKYDRKILLERGIAGREFECAVLGGDDPTASVPCEIIPSQDFYTYEDKYLLNQARIELPAKLTAGETAEMQRLAVECFDAVGTRAWRGWTFSWKPPLGASTSTKSIRFRASLPLACIQRCWSIQASPTRDYWIRSSTWRCSARRPGWKHSTNDENRSQNGGLSRRC